MVDMGQRFKLIVNIVDVVPTEAALPKLPVARVLWQPRPNLKTAAAAWILAGGAHHTSFSFDVTAQQLQDFAEMADIEMLLIYENTDIAGFKKELRWNEIYYNLARGV
jgi:L-arabinose isomerase